MSNFPCESDLNFFEARRTPAWALCMRAKKTSLVAWRTSTLEMVDYCVNAHARIRSTEGERAAGNLLAILASYRRRKKDLLRELETLSAHPECAINPEKRAAFARKWAKRLRAQS